MPYLTSANNPNLNDFKIWNDWHCSGKTQFALHLHSKSAKLAVALSPSRPRPRSWQRKTEAVCRPPRSRPRPHPQTVTQYQQWCRSILVSIFQTLKHSENDSNFNLWWNRFPGEGRRVRTRAGKEKEARARAARAKAKARVVLWIYFQVILSPPNLSIISKFKYY